MFERNQPLRKQFTCTTCFWKLSHPTMLTLQRMSPVRSCAPLAATRCTIPDVPESRGTTVFISSTSAKGCPAVMR